MQEASPWIMNHGPWTMGELVKYLLEYSVLGVLVLVQAKIALLRISPNNSDGVARADTGVAL